MIQFLSLNFSFFTAKIRFNIKSLTEEFYLQLNQLLMFSFVQNWSCLIFFSNRVQLLINELLIEKSCTKPFATSNCRSMYIYLITLKYVRKKIKNISSCEKAWDNNKYNQLPMIYNIYYYYYKLNANKLNMLAT